MKRKFVLLLLLVSAPTAWADSVSHRKAVDELMSVIQAERVLVSWRQRLDAQAIEVINQSLDGKTEAQLSEAQRAAVLRFSQRANASLDTALKWERFQGAAAQIYMENYSENEVHELTNFYRSALGQKHLHQGPRIADAVGQLLRLQIQNALPEFQKIGQEFNREYAAAPATSARATLKAGQENVLSARPSGINPKTGR